MSPDTYHKNSYHDMYFVWIQLQPIASEFMTWQRYQGGANLPNFQLQFENYSC